MPGRKVKVYTATLIVIASMIGIGVFTSLGFQLVGVRSGFGILMLWLVGGIIALCGALCYGELASAMPRSGGEYHYLSEIFHPLAGFLSGWLSATVAFAAPTAIAAMALGTYVNTVFPVLNKTVLAVSVIVIVTFIHSFNLRQSSRFQNIFTLVEITLIIFFIIAGFMINTPQTISLLPQQSKIAEEGWQAIFSSSFAVSLIYVSYAYSGWNMATYMASDIENPRRNVPKALFNGTLIVIVLYILLNYIFMYSAPVKEMLAKPEEVGLISAIHIFGLKAGKLMGMMIALLLVASISSFILAGPRVAQVIGEDLPQLSFLSIKNKHGVPYVAKIIQGVISLLLILTGSFGKVILYIGFTLSLSTFLTVFGLFILRAKNKGKTGGYKTFGYPFTPIVFLALTAWMIFFTIKEHPKESLLGLGTILAGSVVYFIKNPKYIYMKIIAFLKKISYSFFFIILFFLFHSCVNHTKENAIAVTPVPKDTALNKASADTIKAWQDDDFGKIAFDRRYNDIARYIAGMKAWPGSPYAKLEKDSVWVRFHKNFDYSWNQIAVNRLEPMTTWGNTELAEERKSKMDIFYPLSGPDILHVNYFFPDAKNYRLYALEINGALPDLKNMSTKATENYITEVYKSLGDIFKRSYFITSRMSTTLNAENVNGTLPLLCVFLVRTGHEIISLQYCHLNDDGTETPLPKDSLGTHHNDLVKVYFKNSKNNSIQMVSYMKCDLSDGGYSKNVALKNLFTKMKPSITYIKSASYLLHYGFFSQFRTVILTKSKTLLEDDTGVPYKYFSGDKWYVSLYGQYVKPVSDFSGVFQTDLAQAYTDTILRKPKKLPFSLGYHWNTTKQNLIKAQLRS